MTDTEQQDQRPYLTRDWDTQNWGEADNFLSAMVGGGLQDDVEMDVTLVVHGRVITGTVISGARWFKEQIEAVGEDPETSKGGFASYYRTFRDRTADVQRVVDAPKDDELSDEDEKVLGDFTHVLHLKNAQVRMEVSLNVNYPPNLYMRVRLGSVDAWHFGSATYSVVRTTE